jgi:hypothetical protein
MRNVNLVLVADFISDNAGAATVIIFKRKVSQ